MPVQSNFHVFMLIRALPAWLALPRTERARIASAALASAAAEADLRYRYFDAEAFSARCSDVLMLQIEDVRSYGFAIERLRDSPLFAEPYFELVDIVPALEDGYLDFEQAQAAPRAGPPG